MAAIRTDNPFAKINERLAKISPLLARLFILRILLRLHTTKKPHHTRYTLETNYDRYRGLEFQNMSAAKKGMVYFVQVG